MTAKGTSNIRPCPKCHTVVHVVPVAYGLGSSFLPVGLTPDGKAYNLGTCVPGRSRRYCKRCDKLF